MDCNPIPDEHADYWQGVYRESPVRTLKAIKEGAGQLIAISSALQAVYFLVISVSDLRAAISDWTILLFILPMPFWLACLALAIAVFVPESRYVTLRPERIESAFRETARHKLLLLKSAQWILVLSMVALLAVVIIYLWYVPVFPPHASNIRL